MSSENPPTATRAPTPSERPSSFRFELGWANAEQRLVIIERLRRMNRQTMNLRLMPTARLVYLKSLASGELVGWGGVDKDHNPEFPELFSLHVDAAYRTYTLGLVLELARYTYLLNHGFAVAYARMERATNYSLLRYRITKGLYQPIERTQLDRAWASMCTQCELYQRDCVEQAYFSIDVANFVRHGVDRVGSIDVDALPDAFELRPEILRTKLRQLHPDLPGQQRKPYRPYWI